MLLNGESGEVGKHTFPALKDLVEPLVKPLNILMTRDFYENVLLAPNPPFVALHKLLFRVGLDTFL